jgi:hypothetical protein
MNFSVDGSGLVFYGNGPQSHMKIVQVLASWTCLDLQLCFFNPLNADLNPICHLLALLRDHHILHVSRIRVKVVYTARFLSKRLQT